MAEELLQILDENGKPTGKLEKRSVIHKEGLFHYEVALFIYNDKGELLLQRRSPNKKSNPNKLAIVAGHVAGLDTLEESVVRESEEEIGLKINAAKLKLLNYEKRVKENKEESNNIFNAVYIYKSNLAIDKFILQKEEVSEVLWVSFEKVKNMMLANDEETVFKNTPYYKKIFDLIEKEIKGE